MRLDKIIARSRILELRSTELKGALEEMLEVCVEKFPDLKPEVLLRGLLARGEFPISPDEGFGGHCAYCSYARVCRKAHLPARRRAEGSDAVAALMKARGETT